MGKSARETVIIVHGTWAGLKAGVLRWYQPSEGAAAPGEFVAKLDAALEKRGSPARCWAHCAQGNKLFHWSGDNNWIVRTGAAAALADYVVKLRNEGWRCHIVAHSHGGNVLVEALPQIVTPNKGDGKLVTLGTPFMDTTSPILNKIKSRDRILSLVSWGLFASLVFLLVFGLVNRLYINPLDCISVTCMIYAVGVKYASVEPGWIFLGSLIFLFLTGFFIRRKNRRFLTDFWAAIAKAGHTKQQLLVMSSLMDEPWQVLHHMRSIDNPLAIRSNIFAYLFSSLRLYAVQSALVARIHGSKSFKDLTTAAKVVLSFMYLEYFVIVVVLLYCLEIFLGFDPTATNLPDNLAGRPVAVLLFLVAVYFFPFLLVLQVFTTIFGESFFSAFLSPLRCIAQRFRALATLLPTIGTYIVRRKGWSVVLAITTGLERYRFTMPSIEQFPKNVPKTFVKHENIPASVEQRALSRRSAWIGRHIGDVSEAFSKMVVTAADITALLQTIEEDQTLVHAAYYTDDECIDRIADWIADRD